MLKTVGGKISGLAQRLELGYRATAYFAWVRDRGDLTRRLDYPLNADSVVWDAGGFEGQWTSDIVGRFDCRVHVFEPAPPAIALLRRRFAANPRITVHPFALGAADGELKLSLAGDSSSLVVAAGAGAMAIVAVREAVAVWRELGMSRVALLKINIEGGEYELLDHLIQSGLIAAIDDLQVQFHDFVPEAHSRRRRLETALGRTHARTWCYDFVWENWRRLPAG